MEKSPKIALQLPILRALAIMTTVGLGFVNLYYDAKEGSETNLRWAIAIAQFLTIGLLLFQSDPRLLAAAFGLALLCTALVWPRFASHESVRLPYIITQGVAAGLIGYMLFARIWKLRKIRQDKFLRDSVVMDEQKRANLLETEKDIQTKRNNLRRTKHRSDEQDKELDSLNVELKNIRAQQASLAKEASKRSDELEVKEKASRDEKKALISKALGPDFEDDGVEMSAIAIESSRVADNLDAGKGKVIVL